MVESNHFWEGTTKCWAYGRVISALGALKTGFRFSLILRKIAFSLEEVIFSKKIVHLNNKRNEREREIINSLSLWRPCTSYILYILLSLFDYLLSIFTPQLCNILFFAKLWKRIPLDQSDHLLIIMRYDDRVWVCEWYNPLHNSLFLLLVEDH